MHLAGYIRRSGVFLSRILPFPDEILLLKNFFLNVVHPGGNNFRYSGNRRLFLSVHCGERFVQQSEHSRLFYIAK